MELATLPVQESIETEAEPDDLPEIEVIAAVQDPQYDEPLTITADNARIIRYDNSGNQRSSCLNCLGVELENRDMRYSWLSRQALELLEEEGISSTLEPQVTADALERYAAAQAIYAELGRTPELFMLAPLAAGAN